MDKVILALQSIISESVSQQATANVGPLKDIKAVYYGDPSQIADTYMPAIAIQPINSNFSLRGTRYDEKIHTIEVRIIINRKEYYTDQDASQKVTAVQDMANRIESQWNNEDVIHTSICGIIQNNLCLQYTNDLSQLVSAATLSKVVSVQYRFSTERGFPTYEGVVTLEVHTIWDR